MLKDEIKAAEEKVMQARRALNDAMHELRLAELRRAECEHDFTPAVRGFEHEGGYCKKCGINQVYAECQKIGVFNKPLWR